MEGIFHSDNIEISCNPPNSTHLNSNNAVPVKRPNADENNTENIETCDTNQGVNEVNQLTGGIGKPFLTTVKQGLLRWKLLLAIGSAVTAVVIVSTVVAVTTSSSSDDGPESLPPSNEVTGSSWSEWGSWSPCSTTCGPGTRYRNRTCLSDEEMLSCDGTANETQACSLPTPDVKGKWTTWQPWSNCDESCGGGRQTRSRTCTIGASPSNDCIGSSMSARDCNIFDCPDCNRNCTEGKLHDTCDICICSLNVTGIVRGPTGSPLPNVTIFHSSSPIRMLGETNLGGRFVLLFLCQEDTLLFRKSHYLDKTVVNITENTDDIQMLFAGVPYMQRHPRSQAGLVGNNMSLTCAAKNSESLSYEWFKDGNVIREGSEALNLNNVRLNDTGVYRCRVNGPGGSIFSDEAFIDVKGASEEYCRNSLDVRYVTLPQDCIQSDTGSNMLQIHTCLPKPCDKQTNNSSSSILPENTERRCGPTGFERRSITCSSITMTMYDVTTCGCEAEYTLPKETIINGIVTKASDGNSLSEIKVFVDGSKVAETTGGKFSFKISSYKRRLSMFLEDSHKEFSDTVTVFHKDDNVFETSEIRISLPELSQSSFFDSEVGGILSRGDSSLISLTILDNAVYRKDGSQYTGNVTAHIDLYDARNSTQVSFLPGDNIYVDEEGGQIIIQSVLTFRLLLLLNNAEELYMTKSITVHINTQLITLPNEYFLFGLDETTGYWFKVQHTSSASSANHTLSDIDPSTQRFLMIGTLHQDTMDCYLNLKAYHLSSGTTPPSYTRSVSTYLNDKQNIAERIHESSVLSDTHRMICGNDLSGRLDVSRSGRTFNAPTCSSLAGCGIVERLIDLLEYTRIGNTTIGTKFITIQDGPFYSNNYASCGNQFNFLEMSTNLQFKTLDVNPRVEKGLQLADEELGRAIWYPFRNMNSMSTAKIFRICMVRVRISDRTSVPDGTRIRVISLGGHSSVDGVILGVHEDEVVDRQACVEYKCSGTVPLFLNSDAAEVEANTRVRINSIGASCTEFEMDVPSNSESGQFIADVSDYNSIETQLDTLKTTCLASGDAFAQLSNC